MFYKVSLTAFIFLVTLGSLTPSVSAHWNPELNPCSVAKCENFAKCVPHNIFNYTCQCSQYWTGEYCQLPSASNPCFSSPCKQDSTCLLDVEFNLSYKCICQPGYTGPACDILIDVVI